MSLLLDLYLNQFLVFVMVLARVGGLVMGMPILGSRSIPMQVRALLAVAVSLLIAPLYWGVSVQYPGNILHLLVFVGGEALVGLGLGMGVLILFSGIQLTGQIMGQMSGSQLADIFDPTFNQTVPIYAQLMDIITLSVFLIIGGHRQVMDALLATFRQIPPGGGGFSSSSMVTLVTDVLTQSFILGIRAAAPVIVALLMSVLIMGLISRTLPQLNILAMGFSLNAMIMLGTLAISLGSIVWIFQEQVEPTLEAIREILLEGNV